MELSHYTLDKTKLTRISVSESCELRANTVYQAFRNKAIAMDSAKKIRNRKNNDKTYSLTGTWRGEVCGLVWKGINSQTNMSSIVRPSQSEDYHNAHYSHVTKSHDERAAEALDEIVMRG